MNMQEIFRRVMGLNPRHPGGSNEDPVNRFRNPPWGDEPDEDDEFDELYTDYRRGPGFESGFNVFAGDAMDMHKYFEQQMSEMMRSFGLFGLQTFEDPGSLQLPHGENDNRLESPRDRYLKPGLGERQGSSSSQTKADSDLDHRISREGIAALFKKEPEEEAVLHPEHNLERPRTEMFSRSTFSSKVFFGNGLVVEEKVKEWNSNGTETQTVRRRLGDEFHSVTITKDPTGEISQHEELINVDKDSLGDFNNKWSRSRFDRSVGWSSSPANDIAPDQPPSSANLLSTLWRLFS